VLLGRDAPRALKGSSGAVSRIDSRRQLPSTHGSLLLCRLPRSLLLAAAEDPAGQAAFKRLPIPLFVNCFLEGTVQPNGIVCKAIKLRIRINMGWSSYSPRADMESTTPNPSPSRVVCTDQRLCSRRAWWTGASVSRCRAPRR
jgi:hypothetical protein